MLLFFLISLYFLLLPQNTLAESSIFINEFQIEPDQSVELYNSSEEIVDLSGWFLDDSGGTTYFTIPSETLLYPNSCLVFSQNLNLNKSTSDTVRLFDNTAAPTSTLSALIDSVSYEKSPGENLSLQKGADGTWLSAVSNLGLDNESQQSCLYTPVATLTPTTNVNSAPTPTVTPTVITPTSIIDTAKIFLSEVMSYPDAENEWVELYNANDYSVSLDNWYLDDLENAGSTPKKFSLSLPANSYLAFYLSSSIFNNSGDAVRLLNPDQEEIFSLEYPSQTKGQSYSRQDFTNESLWCKTEASPNSANNSCLDSSKQTSENEEAKKVETKEQKTSAKQQTTNSNKPSQSKNSNFSSNFKLYKPFAKVLGITVVNKKTDSGKTKKYLPFLYLARLLAIASLVLSLTTLFITLNFRYNFFNDQEMDPAFFET